MGKNHKSVRRLKIYIEIGQNSPTCTHTHSLTQIRTPYVRSRITQFTQFSVALAYIDSTKAALHSN